MNEIIRLLLIGALLTGGAVAAKDDDDHLSGQHKAVLTGYDQVPAVYTTGTGLAVVEADETGKELKVTLSYSNLKGAPKAAHIRLGQEGANGGIVAALCGDGKPACPVQVSDLEVVIKAADVKAVQGVEAAALDAVIDALNHDALYVSVQTDKFADGEIRGQLQRGMGQKGNNDNGNNDNASDDKDEKGNGKDKKK
jgi:hypothetical protein